MASPSVIPKVWDVRASPGKGRGVFATQDIIRGDLIMLETPIMAIQRSEPNQLPTADALKVKAAFDSLPPAEQTRFLTLSADGRPSTTTTLVRLFYNNALVGADNISRICIDISLLNHSCVPNAYRSFRGDTGTGEVKYFVTATTDIRKDEEICVTYADYCMNYTAVERAAILWELWHFRCDCRACTPETDFQIASDNRRIMYHATTRILERCNRQQPKALPYQEYAHAATGKVQLFTLNHALIDAFSEVDITSIWWQRAKLLLEENNLDENLLEAYARMRQSLGARMTRAGAEGRRYERLWVYLAGVRHMSKRVSEWSRILHRSTGRPVYRDVIDRDPWTRGQQPDPEFCNNFVQDLIRHGINGTPCTLEAAHQRLAQMTLSRPVYGQDGQVITMYHRESAENMFAEEDDPGRAFQVEYGRMFGHLYED